MRTLTLLFVSLAAHAQILAPIISGGVQAYYVDSVAGNDANAGTTPDTAVKTIAQLVVLDTAAPRSVWRLKKDGVWREQLTVPRNNMTVEAYGTGTNRPILDASDVIAAGAWAKTGGRTNVYQASITLAQTATIYTNVWVDGARLVRVSDVATCDTTPGSYTLSEAAVNTTLYIHSTGSTDPTGDAKTYEVSIRNYGLLAENRSGTVVRGIHTQKNLNQNGSLFLGTNSRVYDCRASWGNKHNLFVRGGSLVEDTTADEAYYGTTPLLMIVYYEDVGPGTDVTFRRVTVSSTTGITGSGIGGHTSSGNFGTITCDTCSATGLEAANGNNSTAFNFNNATAAVLLNCSTAATVGGAVGVNIPTTITGGTFLAKTIGISMATAGASVVADGVTITMGAGTAPSAIRSLVANSSVTIRNSTITDAGGWMFQLTGANLTLVADHNTYVSGGFGWYDLGAQGYTGVTSDYNAFQQAGKNCRYGNTSYSLANWKTNTGQDAHSTP